MADKHKVYRSADTGEYVTEEFAKANPTTTYATTEEHDHADDVEVDLSEVEEATPLSESQPETPPLPDDGINL